MLFTSTWRLCFWVCSVVCFSVFVITLKKMIGFFMWIGPDQRKKLNFFRRIQFLKQKIPDFQRSYFLCIFNDFGFLIDVTPEVLGESS